MKTAGNISDHFIATFGLAERSHVERIEIATQDILLADPFWSHADVCGSRIYRTAESTLWPDSEWPMLTVSSVQSELPWQFAGEAEITLPMMVRLFFHELRGRIQPGEVNSRTFAHRLWMSLSSTEADRYLKVARFGNEPLVDQPPQAGTIVFGDVRLVQELPPEEDIVAGAELGESQESALGAERYLELAFSHTFNIDRVTGQVPEFTGE